MKFTNHFSTSTICIQYLRKETPEGVFFTEYSLPALRAGLMGLKRLGGNKISKAFGQLTDRILSYFGELISEPLAR
ncbi:MAG: hypothetical protein GY815_16485 [Gammaproteobacteria bacterium]|nr:hypothetical protein [Gammaproteobacteria bacterium]